MKWLQHKPDMPTECSKQAGDFTNTVKVKVDLCLPEFSSTKELTWNFHMDDSTEVQYYIIIGIYILTSMMLYLRLSKYAI